MFLGPLEMTKPWNTRGVEGVYRFLGRVWRLFVDESSETEFEQRCTASPDQAALHLSTLRPHPAIGSAQPTSAQLRTLHACIRKVTVDLDHLRFNTAISALMVFVNDAITWEIRPLETLRTFLVLLHPFAPHLAEELWQLLDTHRKPGAGTETPTAPHTIAYMPWPRFDPALLVEETLEIPVQVNGKLRDRIRIPADATQTQVEQAALAAEKIAPLLPGKTVRKIIVVPGKLVNLVVSP
jgi:leucyl-tRNA synthetase